MRPIRFGHQARLAHGDDPGESARRAEGLGFDVFLLADHIGPQLSPLVGLAAACSATSTIRLGTFVLNSDMRNPVQLAWEATTLDHLSGGRFELGLGAGHTPQEYAATGVELRSPTERKSALAERVEIIRRLVDGESVTFDGQHHHIIDASILRSHQDHLPILVGGNGEALLRHAGAHADIIGLQGLGRTLADGHEHTVKWTPAHLDRQIEQVLAGARDRVADIELNALVQVVEITDDPRTALDKAVDMIGGGVTAADLDAIPYVLIGSVDAIAEKILHCRNHWGISYFVVRSLGHFGPVIERVRALETSG